MNTTPTQNQPDARALEAARELNAALSEILTDDTVNQLAAIIQRVCFAGQTRNTLSLSLKPCGDCWLHVNAPSGLKASINLGQRGDFNDPTIVGRTIREVAELQQDVAPSVATSPAPADPRAPRTAVSGINPDHDRLCAVLAEVVTIDENHRLDLLVGGYERVVEAVKGFAGQNNLASAHPTTPAAPSVLIAEDGGAAQLTAPSDPQAIANNNSTSIMDCFNTLMHELECDPSYSFGALSDMRGETFVKKAERVRAFILKSLTKYPHGNTDDVTIQNAIAEAASSCFFIIGDTDWENETEDQSVARFSDKIAAILLPTIACLVAERDEALKERDEHKENAGRWSAANHRQIGVIQSQRALLATAQAERDGLREDKERLLNVARGCLDYSGGHHDKDRETFHHGINTVIRALEATAKRDPNDTQVNALERMGRATNEGGSGT